MALGPDDLILGYMSMTHVEPPWTFVGASFEDRCRAAAAGGFAGIGIVPSVYDDTQAAGLSDADMRSLLRESGVVLGEVEAGIPMPAPSELDAYARDLEHVFEVATALGAERIFFVGAPGVSLADLSATFAQVCDWCAERDVIAALEFMDIPSLSAVPDAAAALEVVRGADRPNGGVLVDVYHQINGSNDWSQLEALPGELVTAIQFDDTAIPRVDSDYLQDTLHHRRVPGEGDADVVRFVRTMDAIGARCPYSLEVISDELVRLAPVELGQRLGSATRAVLAQARA